MELALVAPVLILLIAGIIDFGWYFFTKQLQTSNTLEATRAAAMADWSQDPAASAELALTDADSSVTTTYSGWPPQVALTVSVESEYDGLFGLVPMPATVGTQLTMRLEDQPSEDEYEAAGGEPPEESE